MDTGGYLLRLGRVRPGNCSSSELSFKASCKVDSDGENSVACENFIRSGALDGSATDALACCCGDKGRSQRLVSGHRVPSSAMSPL